MKATIIDKLFVEGHDVSEFLNHEKIKRPNQMHKRVNVDFPEWMVSSLDKEAQKLGIARQALIKIWISERLEKKV